MVPVYHYPHEEGVLLLLCVVGRQLEATSVISDFTTMDYVCGLKVLKLGGSYPSAASTHWGQVVLGGWGGGGGYGGDETSSYLVHKSQACLSATFGQRG